ncbi:hypothetical protein KW805_01175 [Candidatus Pacearchaeota archaeon]|nr:hypothetical protein [Candidatus Pacearchaeota archaeon]
MENRIETFLEIYNSDEGTEKDEVLKEERRKQREYWKSWENVSTALQNITKELGHFPTQKEITQSQYIGLMYGISRYHNNLYTATLKMGHTPTQGERGHWKKWENVEKELKGMIEQLGHYPSYTEIRKLKGSITSAIDKHHGGYNNTRARMGFDLSRREPGYWESSENVVKEAKSVMKKYGFDELPDANKLTELGETQLIGGISSYGGFKKVRRLLGEEQRYADVGTWHNLENCIKKAQEIKRELGVKTLPSTNILQDHGYGAFVAGIQAHHGGIVEFRKKLGEQQLKRESGIWRSLEYTIQEAKKFLEEKGLEVLPGQSTIQNSGYSGLVAAINLYHGGLKEFEPKFYQAIGKSVDKSLLRRREKVVNIPKETLEREYNQEKMTQSEIAEKHDCAIPAIKRLMDEHGIKTRNTSEYHRPDGFIEPKKSELRQWYVKEEKSLREIGDELGVSRRVVQGFMEKYDIPIRSNRTFEELLKKIEKSELENYYIDKRMTPVQVADKLGVSGPTVKKLLEYHEIPMRNISQARLRKGVQLPTKEELVRLYVQERKNTVEIGEILGISNPTVGILLRKHDIEVRNKKGIYDNKKTRKETIYELLTISGKNPEKLVIRDFQNYQRDDGTCFIGLLGWYQRNYECTPTQAKNKMLQELVGCTALHEPKRAKRVSLNEVDSWDKLKKKINELFRDHPELKREMPGSAWLRKNGYTFIGRAAPLYGGMASIRDKLGQPQMRVENGKWKEFNAVKAELQRIIDTHDELEGFAPSGNWLNEHGYSYLTSAIKRYHGHYSVFVEKFEKASGISKESNLEGLLGNYIGGNDD